MKDFAWGVEKRKNKELWCICLTKKEAEDEKRTFEYTSDEHFDIFKIFIQKEATKK